MLSILRVRRISCLFSLFSDQQLIANPLINSGISKSPCLVTFTLAFTQPISCQQSNTKYHQFHQFTSALFTMCIILVLSLRLEQADRNWFGLVELKATGEEGELGMSPSIFLLQYLFPPLRDQHSKQAVSEHAQSQQCTELDSFFQGKGKECGEMKRIYTGFLLWYALSPIVLILKVKLRYFVSMQNGLEGECKLAQLNPGLQA